MAKKLSYDEVYDYISAKGCKLLSKDYIKARDKLKVQCSCGNIYEVDFNHFKSQNQTRCTDCTKTTRVSYSIIKKHIEENTDNTLLSHFQEHMTVKTKLTIRCSCGNIYTTDFNHFKDQNKKQCDECGTKLRNKHLTKSHQKFVNEVYTLEQDKYSVIGTYKNARTKIQMKHNECGRIYKVTPNNFLYGFRCPFCCNTTSFNERFVIALLDQLNVEFIAEYRDYWTHNKRYDFYIPSENCIIETHGKQHYDKHGFSLLGGRTLKEEQENDKFKEMLAKENGIKNYIIIDCRESSLEWIKNGVLHSKLNGLFDLSNIKWLECEQFAHTNLLKQVCDLWNNGYTFIKDIANELGISPNRTSHYLNIGANLNLCNYSKEKAKLNFSKSRYKKQ